MERDEGYATGAIPPSGPPSEPKETNDDPEPDKPPGEVQTCEEFDENTPDTAQLSPTWKLADVSSATSYSRYRVVPNQGLSRAQIICNLKNVLVNCIEQIKSHVESINHTMIITSGFRPEGGSQHGRGEAIDMQFPSMTNEQAYRVAEWIKQNIPYDQLITEWHAPPKMVLHVSWSKTPGSRGAFKDMTLDRNNNPRPGLMLLG